MAAQVKLTTGASLANWGLADEEHGEEPSTQRQLRVLHHGAGQQRRLPSAAPALEHDAAAVGHTVRLAPTAVGAPESAGPALAHQFLDALLLRAEPVQKLWQRQTELELDAIAGHASLPGPAYAPTGSWRELPVRCDESG